MINVTIAWICGDKQTHRHKHVQLAEFLTFVNQSDMLTGPSFSMVASKST